MGYKITRFKQREQVKWGVVREEKIYPLAGDYPLLADLLRHGLSDIQALAEHPAGEALDVNTSEILNPVTSPCNIVCQGKNYVQHRLETGSSAKRPEFNLLFSKASSSLAPPKGKVICPAHVKLFDYELELGLVIGRDIKKPQTITPDNFTEFVCGLVMANDMSARDVQIPQDQWFKGKSYRGFCPTGPYLFMLEKSDIGRLKELQLTLKVNGDIRQQADTGQLLFSPAETVTETTEVMDLFAGDLILTGTPGGVALSLPGGMVRNLAAMIFSEPTRMRMFIENQLKNPRYLKNGDIIESMIQSKDGQIDLGMQQLEVVKMI